MTHICFTKPQHRFITEEWGGGGLLGLNTFGGLPATKFKSSAYLGVKICIFAPGGGNFKRGVTKVRHLMSEIGTSRTFIDGS